MGEHTRTNTTAPKPRAIVGTPWWVRLAVYVTVAIVGLALTALGIVQPEQVDGWLGQTGGLAALIGGLLAAVNTGRASDESPADEIARKIDVAPTTPAEGDANFSVYKG